VIQPIPLTMALIHETFVQAASYSLRQVFFRTFTQGRLYFVRSGVWRVQTKPAVVQPLGTKL
jgi:hypothetical protein